MQRPPATPNPSTPLWLGYAGLIPFIVLAAGVVAGGSYRPLCSRALFAYGAVILSFVGALHWAFAMTLPDLSARRRNAAFAWSVIPALLAWLALLLSPAAAAALLGVGFLAQYLRDRGLAAQSSLPAWYLPLRGRLTSIACVCLTVGAFVLSAASLASAAAPAAATPAPPSPSSSPSWPSSPPYREATASPDGIGKFYAGREIAQVMGFDGAPWLDRASREQEERPDILVEELHVTPGMTVADIGAGSGYLARRLAPRVAPGQVFAVDVQPQMVALLQQLAAQPGMGNVVPKQGAVDDVRLPDSSVDLAVMVDVYHELEFPLEVVRSIVRALKPGGRLVLVEYRGEDPTVPIKALHKMTEKQIRLELERGPLTWERTAERLPVQHIVVFKKPARAS